MIKILNVAEKNDAARNISEILSCGYSQRREGYSVYNKIYEFSTALHGQQCQMIFTSVSGHVLNKEFVGSYRKWYGCSPLDLFDAPVIKACTDDMLNVKKTLERECKFVKKLIIWTDCDREGENIGFEIIDICNAINPSIQVLRAKFSEITHNSINRALQTLGEPNKRISDAVDVRSELDLRIGAAFTRFQTLRLQKVFPEKLKETLISYGSCQFPTLGFVVERYKAIENFIPEKFWKIKVIHDSDEGLVEFKWHRIRLFDENACAALLESCQDNPVAKVVKMSVKPKSKWRPLPLDTVELEKLSCRKLLITAKEAMRIAEKLYTAGYISYPRTETNIFPKDLNLHAMVESQTGDPNWGNYASRLLEEGITPRQGKKSDQAHPPIYPTKYTSSLQGDERKLYEFIVRHFLACISKDAKGQETVVEIQIANENFFANGLIILERNYLEVYPYDKWSNKFLPLYQLDQIVNPVTIGMVDSETSPPTLLTEADLIALMEKHGIGTDATHAEHIETIKSRMYVGLQDLRFVPGQLGMGLVEGYDSMGFEMSKPFLRAELEADLKRICDGEKNPATVLEEQISQYKEVFREAMRQAEKIDTALSQYLGEAPQTTDTVNLESEFATCPVISKCPECQMDVTLKQKREGKGFYITCQGYPTCKGTIWLPDTVEAVSVLDTLCNKCGSKPRKLKFKFTHRAYLPVLPDEYETCLGCDVILFETLDIRPLSKLCESKLRNAQGHELPNSHKKKIVLSKKSKCPQSRSIFTGTLQTSVCSGEGEPVCSLTSQSHRRNYSVDSNVNTNYRDTSSSLLSVQRNDSGYHSNSSPHSNTQNNIVCSCNEDAVCLTVKKSGPNQGRQFYKCSRQTCNFFLWADGMERTDNSAQNEPSRLQVKENNVYLNEMSSQVSCNCGIVAKKLTVQKDGPNKGREFYACDKIRNEQCGFFQWADESSSCNSSNYSSNKRKYNGDDNKNSKNYMVLSKQKENFKGNPRKRKCGLCGEEGHNRLKCPSNQF